MSVHQISEYYIHMTIPSGKVAAVKDLLLEEYVDYELHGRDLTIDGFDSERGAIEFENQIKALL